MGLVSMGSCGAFVHGLEDECYSVRVAAVGMGIYLQNKFCISVNGYAEFYFFSSLNPV